MIAYGQQGSGKTFTIIGPQLIRIMSEEDHGLIPRAAKQIFSLMQQIPRRTYKFSVTYIIIHQDTVYDLLSNGLVALNVLENNDVS